MRDVRNEPARPYAAHVAGHNSWTLGIAVCAMGGATPFNFGRWPLTREQIDAMASVAARLAAVYSISVDAIRTHAEAAVVDGYFGADGADLRWDIARLEANDMALEPREAAAVGNILREQIVAAL